MSRWIRCAVRGCIVGTVISGGLLAGLGCKKQVQGSMAPAMPPPLVNVAAAEARDVPLYLDEIGKAEATESVTIMPQVAGRVDAPLHFADGADLKKGQVLFTLDARPFVAVVHQAEAQLEKDQAALANAERFLKRQEDIFKQGFVAPSDYDTAVFNVRADKGAVAADQAAIESAKLNVDYCTIKSPIDGRAGMRLVDPGNIVNINQTAMLVIQRIDPIYADFTINERDLPQVRAHMANQSLVTYVRLPNETGQGHSGSLTFLDNAVADASGTIKLRATLDNPGRHFWPGQFVKVRLVLQILEKAVLIPSAALQLSQQGPYVFVVKADGTAEQRNVVLGQEQGDMMLIKKGVKDGEKVITNGQLLVFPGGKVNVQATPVLGAAPTATQPSTDNDDQREPTTAPAETQPTTKPASQPVVLGQDVGFAPSPRYSGERVGVRGDLVGSALADVGNAHPLKIMHLFEERSLSASVKADPTNPGPTPYPRVDERERAEDRFALAAFDRSTATHGRATRATVGRLS